RLQRSSPAAARSRYSRPGTLLLSTAPQPSLLLRDGALPPRPPLPLRASCLRTRVLPRSSQPPLRLRGDAPSSLLLRGARARRVLRRSSSWLLVLLLPSRRRPVLLRPSLPLPLLLRPSLLLPLLLQPSWRAL